MTGVLRPVRIVPLAVTLGSFERTRAGARFGDLRGVLAVMALTSVRFAVGLAVRFGAMRARRVLAVRLGGMRLGRAIFSRCVGAIVVAMRAAIVTARTAMLATLFVAALLTRTLLTTLCRLRFDRFAGLRWTGLPFA